MNIEQILEQFAGKAPPWGNKLTPSALDDLKKSLEALCAQIYQEGMTAGYKEAEKDRPKHGVWDY